MSHNEIDPFTSERILDAASRGQGIEGFDELGELFAAVHQPVTAAEAVTTLPPQAITPAPNVYNIGRVTRRTAVTATAALFALTGVAAAFTGGASVSGPAGSSHRPAVVDDTPAADAPAAEGAGIAAKSSHEFAPSVEVIEVDATDGPTKIERTECGVAGNHGEYVSQVARDKVTAGPFDPRMSVVAQTECGKPVIEVGSEPDVGANGPSQAGQDHGLGVDNGPASDDHGPSQAGQDHGLGVDNGPASDDHGPSQAGQDHGLGADNSQGQGQSGEHIPAPAGD